MKIRFRVCEKCERLLPLEDYPGGDSRICRDCPPPLIPPPIVIKTLLPPTMPYPGGKRSSPELIRKKIRNWQKEQRKLRKEQKKCKPSQSTL